MYKSLVSCFLLTHCINVFTYILFIFFLISKHVVDIVLSFTSFCAFYKLYDHTLASLLFFMFIVILVLAETVSSFK